MQKKNLHKMPYWTIARRLSSMAQCLKKCQNSICVYIYATPFLAKKFSRKKCVLYLANYGTQDNGHHLTEPLHHVFDGSEEFLLFFLGVGIVVSQIRVSAVLLQCKIHNYVKIGINIKMVYMDQIDN